MRVFLLPPGAKRSGAHGTFSTLINYSTQANAINKTPLNQGITRINLTVIEWGYSLLHYSNFFVGINNQTYVWFNRMRRTLSHAQNYFSYSCKFTRSIISVSCYTRTSALKQLVWAGLKFLLTIFGVLYGQEATIRIFFNRNIAMRTYNSLRWPSG